MCLPERKTESRGRPDAFCTIRKRVRARRRSKRFFVMTLLLLTFLAPDIFSGVANALALVGLRFAVVADLRSNLSDQLLVHARNRQHGGLLGRDRDAGRYRVRHVVAEPELKVQVLALNGRAVTHTLYFELRSEALRYSNDEIVDERAAQAPHLARAFHSFARRHGDSVVA